MAEPEDVLLKLCRAQYHRKIAEGILGSYLSDNMNRFRVKFNAPTDWRVVGLRIDDVPQALPLIVGDCIHNIRASLDYLAGNLVDATGGTRTDFTSFPVVKVAPASNKHGKTPHPNIPGLVKGNQFVKEIRSVLHNLQPYTWGANFMSHPLWRLNELWNHEKHRTLVVTGRLFSDFYNATHEKGVPSYVEGRMVPKEVGKDNVILAYTDPDSDMYFQITFGISLGEITPAAKLPVIETLEYLEGWVRTMAIAPLSTYC